MSRATGTALHGAREIRPTGRLRFRDGNHPGLRGRFREVGARALTTFYRRMLFMAYPLDQFEIPVYKAGIEVDFSELRETEIDEYVSFRPDSDRKEIRARLGEGHRCFISRHEGSLIDACWSATRDVYVPYMNRYLSMPRGDVYNFDSYTAAEHRGHGVYMARNSFQARTNRAEGLKRSIALVAHENYAAWLILARSGLRTLGSYHYVRTPVLPLFWTSPLPGEVIPSLISK
ncbi:MAG: hypothetical protein ABI556_12775 [Gemmatimonadales bacterium]